MTQRTTLLDEVKNYLDITWPTTEAENAKLSSMIERGKAAIAGKIGTCDFDGETQDVYKRQEYKDATCFLCAMTVMRRCMGTEKKKGLRP